MVADGRLHELRDASSKVFFKRSRDPWRIAAKEGSSIVADLAATEDMSPQAVRSDRIPSRRPCPAWRMRVVQSWGFDAQLPSPGVEEVSATQEPLRRPLGNGRGEFPRRPPAAPKAQEPDIEIPGTFQAKSICFLTGRRFRHGGFSPVVPEPAAAAADMEVLRSWPPRLPASSAWKRPVWKQPRSAVEGGQRAGQAWQGRHQRL